MERLKTLAERLVWHRSRLGISQRELAEKSGVSLPQIARYETGKSAPRLKALMNLASALEIDVSDLSDEKSGAEEDREITLSLSDDTILQIEQLAANRGISFNDAVQLLVLWGMKEKLDADPIAKAEFEEASPGAYEAIVKGLQKGAGPKSG